MHARIADRTAPTLRGALSRFKPTSSWICTSCALRSNANRRNIATKAPAKKPYYITTPIFYVNAAPHVGHLYTMVLADIHKRWHVLKGEKALLCTGTDEHGLKIQRASAKAGVDPKTFCDKGAEIFKVSPHISRDVFWGIADLNQRSWRRKRKSQTIISYGRPIESIKMQYNTLGYTYLERKPCRFLS